ncbi:MAG TPA: hypothetical protein VHM20_08160 [Gammaproteobacteria bacterium]|jgi:hypothetical protein|nr:hypothetical protein [Gammaproteobacteria bacterium]
MPGTNKKEQQLKVLLKEVDEGIALISKYLFSEKIANVIFRFIIMSLQAVIFKVFLAEEEEKTNFEEGVFIGAYLLGGQVLAKFLQKNRMQSLPVSLVEDLSNYPIRLVCQDLEVKTAENSMDQLKILENKKIEIEQLIVDKKAWKKFSIYNQQKRFVSQDVSRCIEEFLLPKANKK